MVLAVILWLTLAPQPLPDAGGSWLDFPGADKVVHALMFGALALVLAVDLSGRECGALSRRALPAAALIAIGVGSHRAGTAADGAGAQR